MLIRSKNKMHIVNIENGVVSAEGDGRSVWNQKVSSQSLDGNE